eukprot:3567076-Rhodomonas_salina.2
MNRFACLSTVGVHVAACSSGKEEVAVECRAMGKVSRSHSCSSDCVPRLASMSAISLPESPIWAATQMKCVCAPRRRRLRSRSRRMSWCFSSSRRG